MKILSWSKQFRIFLAILSLCGRVTWQQPEKAGAELFREPWLGMVAPQGKHWRGQAAENKPGLIREGALVTHISQIFRLQSTKMTEN